VSLPKSVDADKAEATYKKGELTITIPTIAEMDNKSVKVEIIP
jgi:HSP20 family molecular chaperone IbpA